jgi:cell division GTPase FtsZ
VFFYSFSSFNGAIFLLPQVPGLLNVDFADVRAIMKDAGSSLLGIGTATGK